MATLLIPTNTGTGNTATPGTARPSQFNYANFFSDIFGNALSVVGNSYAAERQAKIDLDYQKAKAAQTQQQASTTLLSTSQVAIYGMLILGVFVVFFLFVKAVK